MKKFNLFLTQWENASRRPSLTHRQKRNITQRSSEGNLNLVWMKEERGYAGRGGKNKMFISCWWKVITRKPQMDSFQKPSHCLFGLKRTVIWYKKKAITDSKILDIMCLKPSYCQTEYIPTWKCWLRYRSCSILARHVLSSKAFSTRIYDDTVGEDGC